MSHSPFILQKKRNRQSNVGFLSALLHAVFFLEFIYASASVHQLLFAGKVGMALVANFYFDDVGIFSRTGQAACNPD